MREYGNVYSSFWQSPDIRAVSEDGRMLALYLLTSPHGSLIGCFRMPDAYAAEDLQWNGLERVSKAFEDLESAGFLVRDKATKWVMLNKFLKWNRFDNGNVAKAAAKAFEQVPDGYIKQRLACAILEFGQYLSEGFRNGLETLSEQSRNKGARAGAGARATTGAGAKPSRSKSLSPSQISPGASPPVAPPKPETPTAETWAAYAKAYEARHGAAPVRNAAVNGVLAQFVARIGADESPQVAAFFVGHKNALYVNGMHPVQLLLRDAEKLRTEWATGRQMTRTQAGQVDRTQATFAAFSGMLEEAKAKEVANG